MRSSARQGAVVELMCFQLEACHQPMTEAVFIPWMLSLLVRAVNHLSSTKRDLLLIYPTTITLKFLSNQRRANLKVDHLSTLWGALPNLQILKLLVRVMVQLHQPWVTLWEDVRATQDRVLVLSRLLDSGQVVSLLKEGGIPPLLE